ncbi:MAG: DUF1800 family protein [Burkholderiales bacterium]|nr:DUF1800 family protein [Flavobacterium sp.]
MASLSANTAVLGLKNARHLLRRSSFVYTKSLIDQLATLTPSAALDLLLVDTTSTLSLPFDPLPTGTPDGFWTESTNLSASFADQERKTSIVSGWWWYNAVNSPTVKFKLSHFLSTCFTVEKANNAGSATDFYDYLRLLLFSSYGNYKTLANKMTVNNSMLNYLNNTANVKAAPNENYAREFLELFTIGKGAPISPGNYTNYTEADIVQAAKVLTGFKKQPNRSNIDSDTGIPRGYNSFADHAIEPKIFSNAFNNVTVSSASDALGMDNELNAYVEMIFDQQATSKNICRKLYAYFVKSKISEEAENDIITPLSQQLFADGYEIIPVLRTLLESLHFYDLDDPNPNDETIGAIIKSPLQQFSEIVTFLKVTLPDPLTQQEQFYSVFWNDFAHNTYFKSANMMPFDPENVAGHPAYYQTPDYDKNWISASSLIARYRLGESLLYGENRINGNAPIAAQLNILDVVRNGNIISVPDDAYILTSELCNALFACETDSNRVNYFMNTFLLQGSPENDWTLLWSFYIDANFITVVDLRLKELVLNILKAPESQMF